MNFKSSALTGAGVGLLVGVGAYYGIKNSDASHMLGTEGHNLVVILSALLTAILVSAMLYKPNKEEQNSVDLEHSENYIVSHDASQLNVWEEGYYPN